MDSKEQLSGCEYITQGPIQGSEKVYIVSQSDSRVRVPMRRINLSDTVDLDGKSIPNPPVYVYDTSGPFTEGNNFVDVKKGLPKSLG